MQCLIRRDSLENWVNQNPILRKNEIIKVYFESGTSSFKVGDGTTTFSSLPYSEDGLIVIDTRFPLISGGLEILFDC